MDPFQEGITEENKIEIQEYFQDLDNKKNENEFVEDRLNLSKLKSQVIHSEGSNRRLMENEKPNTDVIESIGVQQVEQEIRNEKFVRGD